MESSQRYNALSLLTGAAFLVALLAAAGGLFLKFHLNNAREFSLEALKTYTGIEFTVDTIKTEGLRSLALEGVTLRFPINETDQLSASVDSIHLALSIPAMIQGRITIGDALLQGGNVTLLQPASPKLRINKERKTFVLADLLEKLPFQKLSANDFSFQLKQGELTVVAFEEIALSLVNDAAKGALLLALDSALVTPEEKGQISAKGQIQMPGLVNGQLSLAGINAPLVRHFVDLPEEMEGNVSATVSISGDTDQSLLFDTALDLNQVTLPELPLTLDALQGTVRSVLQWQMADKQIHILKGHLDSNLLVLNLNGLVDMQQEPPVFVLAAEAEGLPHKAVLAKYLPKTLNRIGKPEITLEGEPELRLLLNGPLKTPLLKVEALIPHVNASLQPSNKQLPQASVQVEEIRAFWDSESKEPALSARLTGGSIHATALGFSVDRLSGVLVLKDKQVHLHPFTARLSEKNFAGSALYDLEKQQIEFDVDGELTSLENTVLKDAVKKLELAGDVAFHATGSLGLDGTLKAKASADVTRGKVAFEWWLNKPIGVGATITTLDAVLIPGKSLEVTGEAFVEDTQVLADLKYRPGTVGKWDNIRTRIDLPHLEVNSAGKCINIPYTALGGACKQGFYESNFVGPLPGDSIAKLGGHFDHVSFYPDGGIHPLECWDAKVDVVITTVKNQPKTTELTIHAGDAHVPPFSETWILPMGASQMDDDDDESEPKEPTLWTFNLSADSISLPPWKGEAFSGKLHDSSKETYFSFFKGKMGDGQLEGTYHHEKLDNVMTLKGTWEDIPAISLIRHLELPEILEGKCTGSVNYTVDRDDPGTTLETQGQFYISDGHFIEHKLYEIFSPSFAQQLGTLPPAALRFKKLSSDLKIIGDQIYTDNVVIASEGLTIKGNGVWVMEGDMTYKIDLAVSPDLAEQIPLMRESFNIQGFRLTQRDIELGFQLSGPTFNPTSELAGLPPIGVTFVSGAADLTGEAMKLLDTPRQLFMSIFRSGGGILGATRTQSQQQ